MSAPRYIENPVRSSEDPFICFLGPRRSAPYTRADRSKVAMSPDQPTVVFLCVHKGASSFIARPFADGLATVFPDLTVVNVGNQIVDDGVSYEELTVPPTGAAFVRVYPLEYDNLIEQQVSADGHLRNTKLVVLRRDPRDAAVSLYFARAFSHSPPKNDAEEWLQRREELVSIGPKRGVRRTARGAMNEFHKMNEIIEARPDALVTSYEELVTDYRGWIDRVGEYLGWPLERQSALFAETRRSFDLPSMVDVNRHVRRITPGNWMEYDDDRFREHLDTLGGEAMRAAGYNWPT